MNKKYQRYINYIADDIEAPYFINMDQMYGLRPDEYELVLSKIYDQPVRIKGDLVYDYEFSNGYICDKGKFWERTIGFILSKKINSAKIKHLSGPGNPDFIVNDTNIEVTTTLNQLSYTKFSDDYLKYNDRKKTFGCKKFILVHDSNTVQPNVINSLENKKDAWVLDVESFSKNINNILNNTLESKRLNICKQRIQYVNIPPLHREKKRTIKHKIDFLDKGNKIKLKLKQDSPDVDLLYIRDTRPNDLALILEVALENKNNYLGRSGFIDILLKKENLKKLFKFHNWKEDTKKRAINREFWFRPAIHMGFIDGDYKITTLGEYFLKLKDQKNDKKFILFFAYRLLNSPGVDDLLEAIKDTQKDMVKNNIFSKQLFKKELIDHIIFMHPQLETVADRYYQSILNWLKTLDIFKWEKKKGAIINNQLINDLNEEFN